MDQPTIKKDQSNKEGEIDPSKGKGEKVEEECSDGLAPLRPHRAIVGKKFKIGGNKAMQAKSPQRQAGDSADAGGDNYADIGSLSAKRPATIPIPKVTECHRAQRTRTAES